MKRACCILSLVVFYLTAAAQTSIILDADTGNEMDDLYAIAGSVLDKELEIEVLISAHFNNVQLLTDSMWHIYPTKNINTLQISQEINENLLQVLGRTNIPHPTGSDRMVGYAWGYYPGAPIPESEGVDLIIDRARKATPDQKLNVVCLGAVSNVAAAILLDTSISKNMRLYALTMRYDLSTGAWDKNSFNARNDINGLDIVLNDTDLEVYIMPGNVARSLTFLREKSIEKLNAIDHPIAEILKKRWDEVSAGNTWIMWDLALTEVIANPSLGKIEWRTAPPENTKRSIGVYTEIDAPRIEKRFWKKLSGLN